MQALPSAHDATLAPRMKLLFDFPPIILFFGTFKYAEANRGMGRCICHPIPGWHRGEGVVGT